MLTPDAAEELLAFYSNAGCDSHGRALTDVWQLGLDELETCHDYIQWLFPLLEPSRAQPQSPVLTASAADVMRQSQDIRERLVRSTRVMAYFYGFTISEENGAWVVAPSRDFENRRRIWVTPYNHNFLRHTRILKSLTLLGLGRLAKAWLDCLASVYQAHAPVIGRESFDYWRAGVM